MMGLCPRPTVQGGLRFGFCVVSIEGYAQGKGVRGREMVED
jgi:hypothetical protein